MKSISQETWGHLSVLLKLTDWWQRVIPDWKGKIEALEAIAASGEAAAIPEFAFLLTYGRGPVWHAAAQAADSLMENLSPMDLAQLDQDMRAFGPCDRRQGNLWQKLRPSDLQPFIQSEHATTLLALASCHNNGHVREAAVQELMLQRNGRELPFLLIRLNDWVPQVRDAAAKAVRARIESAYAIHFISNLSLVFRLRTGVRVDRVFTDDILGLLKRAECKAALQAGMASKDKSVRRASFQLAAEAEPSSRSAIVRAILHDPDPVTRSWAVRHFLPDVTPEDLADIIEPMLSDRYMPVRRAALFAAASKRPDLAAKPLRRALLDSHVSMRETARWFLSTTGVPDARAFYIEAVECGADVHRYAAICGLGENGKLEDVALLTAFLNSSLPKLRRAAVYATGKLDAEGNLTTLTEFLSDAKPGVSKEALKALLPRVRHLPLEELERLFTANAAFHVRRNALTLILHKEKWRKLPVLLSACADEDAEIAGLAADALRVWFATYNRSYVEPARVDYERIKSVLLAVESKLPFGAPDELRDCLKVYFK